VCHGPSDGIQSVKAGFDFALLDHLTRGCTGPGKIGNPAASAEVQPAGRSLLELRSSTAPFRAVFRVLFDGNGLAPSKSRFCFH
jgi:hypothetical protein